MATMIYGMTGKMAITWCHSSLLWTYAIPKTWTHEKHTHPHTPKGSKNNTRVLYGAVFPIGSVRFGAVHCTDPHRRIFALFQNRTPHRTVGFYDHIGKQH